MNEKKTRKMPKINLRSNHIRYGGYNVVVAVIVLAILVALNLLVGQLPGRYTKIDTSGSGVYTLGETTEKVVGDLDLDVTVSVLAARENADSTLSELLSRYDDLSDHLTVQYIDTAVNPSFAGEYNASEAAGGSLVVESEKRYTVVDYNDIYVTTMDYYSYYTTGEYNSSTTFDGEGQITSAIDYVSSDTLPVMYTLTGHGESELSEDLTSSVNKLNIESTSLSLLESEEIPEDASALLINQPTRDLSEEEENEILSYMQEGGSVLYIPVLNPEESMDHFSALLSYYGMSLTGTMVVETDSSLYYQYPYYLLPEVNGDSEITSPIAEAGLSLLVLEAQGIRTSSDIRSSLNLTELVTTSDGAYGKDITGSSSTIEKEEGDEEGPFALAVSAEETLEDENTTKFVVLASQYLLDDSILSSFSVGNADLFLNSVSWMCEHESTISISAKSMDEATLVIPTAAAGILQVVTMILLPVGILIAGIAVWLWRRRK